MPFIPFLETTIQEAWQYTHINKDVTERLADELRRRGYRDVEMTLNNSEWRSFYKKLLCFRPRLIGAIAAHSTLTGALYHEKQTSGILGGFHMLFFTGSVQDDSIDMIKKEELILAGKTLLERKKYIQTTIFGRNQIFYRAAFSVFVDYLHESRLTDEQKRYIKHKVADWYQFLLTQETNVIMTPFSEYTFDYSRHYREKQNGKIGAVLTALLNGNKCLDPEYQKLERFIPRLSFRTQIIDDVADTTEDIAIQRPSYAIGALNEFWDELMILKELTKKHPNIKIRPNLLAKLAPRSFDLLLKQYASYGEELLALGKAGKLLKTIGDKLFYLFPTIRDWVYQIAPDFANF